MSVYKTAVIEALANMIGSMNKVYDQLEVAMKERQSREVQFENHGKLLLEMSKEVRSTANHFISEGVKIGFVNDEQEEG